MKPWALRTTPTWPSNVYLPGQVSVDSLQSAIYRARPETASVVSVRVSFWPSVETCPVCGTLVSVAWSCSGWSPRMQCFSSLLSLVARPALAPSFLDLSAIGTVSTGQRCLRLDGGVTSTACRVSESKRRASPRHVSSMQWRACPLKSVCLLHIRSFTHFVTFPLASINSCAGHSRPRRKDNFTLHLGDTVSLPSDQLDAPHLGT